MENHKTYAARSLTLVIICGLIACRQTGSADFKPFRLPKVPLIFTLGKEYLQPDSVERVIRVDSLGQPIRLEIKLLDKKAATLWRIDTMRFRDKTFTPIGKTKKMATIG